MQQSGEVTESVAPTFEELAATSASCSSAKLRSAKLRIKRRIGIGAFGVVYKASLDGRPVAVKVLASEAAGHESAGQQAAQFLRETLCLQRCISR